MAAVLHLRGEQLCAQPAGDAHGNVLLWNGEVCACMICMMAFVFRSALRQQESGLHVGLALLKFVRIPGGVIIANAAFTASPVGGMHA